ncbi:MAG: hypothetical protein OSB51_02730, partial [Dokdonia donghaensis]|nr:hypothetical protein [Dokdonia donghaensis]
MGKTFYFIASNLCSDFRLQKFDFPVDFETKIRIDKLQILHIGTLAYRQGRASPKLISENAVFSTQEIGNVAFLKVNKQRYKPSKR